LRAPPTRYRSPRAAPRVCPRCPRAFPPRRSSDLENATLHSRHRLRDNAWINWGFNDFGWLPDNRTLWYLSEESGHSHLYTLDTAGSGGAVQRTRGQWEASRPVLAADGRSFLVLCNRASPVDYEVCEVPLEG